MSGRRYGTKFDPQIKALFEEGKTLAQSAKILGISRDAVRNGRNRLGIKSPRGRSVDSRCGVQRITDHDERIESLWRAGFSIADIEDDPDIYLQRSTISRRIREMGYKIDKRYMRTNRIPFEEIDRAKELYAQNLSLDKIAEVMGLGCKTSVAIRLKRAGVKKRTVNQSRMIGTATRRANEQLDPPSQTLRILSAGRDGNS